METRSPLSPLVAALFATVCGACAPMVAEQMPTTGMTGPAAAGLSVQELPRREHISITEVRSANVLNAYELVARHRPLWLRGRGVSSVLADNSVMVYLDGTRYGKPELLRQIDINAIRSVRFMSGVEATMRLGTGHGNGVIWVETK